MKRQSRLRDAEKDLVFAISKLQSGNRAAAYLNAMVAVIHIGQEMSEAEHQQVLLVTSRIQPSREST